MYLINFEEELNHSDKLRLIEEFKNNKVSFSFISGTYLKCDIMNYELETTIMDINGSVEQV